MKTKSRQIVVLNDKKEKIYEGNPESPICVISQGSQSIDVHVLEPTPKGGLSLRTMTVPVGMSSAAICEMYLASWER